MEWEDNCEALCEIARSFYQAYQLTGTVKLKFAVRSFEDSDGSGVVDAYISPLDAEAASVLATTDPAKHIQFLESMVPAPLLGYQFVLQITKESSKDVYVSVLEAAPFVTCGV